jgi:hypothetical protein
MPRSSRHPLDFFLTASFCLFAFTSLAMEPYVVFPVDLPMVVLINVPYTIVPLLLAWRVRRSTPFSTTVEALG